MTIKRQHGFYWVRIASAWLIAGWDGMRWEYFGHDAPYVFPSEVDERRITRDDD